MVFPHPSLQNSLYTTYSHSPLALIPAPADRALPTPFFLSAPRSKAANDSTPPAKASRQNNTRFFQEPSPQPLAALFLQLSSATHGRFTISKSNPRQNTQSARRLISRHPLTTITHILALHHAVVRPVESVTSRRSIAKFLLLSPDTPPHIRWYVPVIRHRTLLQVCINCPFRAD